MSLWACPSCHTQNRLQDAQCEVCGTPRAATQPTAHTTRCPFDGHTLWANGWCETGHGFPITRVVSPFVCEQCREPLTWAGTCNRCVASAPGDRYEYTQENPHWQLVEKGPFVILPPVEQAAMAAEYQATIARLIARMTP